MKNNSLTSPRLSSTTSLLHLKWGKCPLKVDHDER